MDPVSILDSYLQKAVNPANADLDISAIDQFCLALKKDPKLVSVAPQLLASRIQSVNTKEALLALEALEECMESCGPEFRSEINKFRFLNELIKLVSKKFDGDKTPKEVSERILNILLTWTNKYEHCIKIQEAYNVLKTQGIEHHPQQNIVVKNSSKPKNEARGSLEDKEFSKLKKLINSSRQEDRDKANLLIQNFYRDDERRTAMKHRRLAELQKVAENTKLLDEMLEQYQPTESTDEERAIIREIYESCEGMHPTIIRLAEETQQSEGMLEKIFEVNDNLTKVLDKYRTLMQTNVETPAKKAPSNTKTSSNSKSASKSGPNIIGPDPMDTLFDVSSMPSASEAQAARSTFEDLSDIFSSTISNTDAQAANKSPNSVGDMLTPLTASSELRSHSLNSSKDDQAKAKYNEIRDLLQHNNDIDGGSKNFNRASVEDNLRLLASKPFADRKIAPAANVGDTESSKLETTSTGRSIPEIDMLVSGIKSTLLSPSADCSKAPPAVGGGEAASLELNHPGSGVAACGATGGHSDDDDKVIDFGAPPSPPVVGEVAVASKPKSDPPATTATPPADMKPLAEIVIDLDNIQPSREPPRTVWDDKEGLQITLNFAIDHPRPDVVVIVISTINQGRTEIPSFHFDASVRKPCKLRLLAPSGSALPATKPFRPPADGITQVLLLANPTREPVDLTCILTYCIGDDPDPIKESIVMKDVPFISE